MWPQSFPIIILQRINKESHLTLPKPPISWPRSTYVLYIANMYMYYTRERVSASCAHHDGLEVRVCLLQLAESLLDAQSRDPDRVQRVVCDGLLYKLHHLGELGGVCDVEHLQLVS